jgi:hypothetical protein
VSLGTPCSSLVLGNALSVRTPTAVVSKTPENKLRRSNGSDQRAVDNHVAGALPKSDLITSDWHHAPTADFLLTAFGQWFFEFAARSLVGCRLWRLCTINRTRVTRGKNWDETLKAKRRVIRR